MKDATPTWAKAQLHEVFAASGKRAQLLHLLAQDKRTVKAPAKAAGLNLTTASAHLQFLKQAGFVTSRRGVRLLTDRGLQGIRLDDGMLKWQLSDPPVQTGASA